MSEKRHPGITMHKFTVGPGFVGLVFTVGCALIFLFGLPALWWFLAFSAALGLAVALVLRKVNRYRSERSKPLSILSLVEKRQTETMPSQRKHSHLSLAVPSPRLT